MVQSRRETPMYGLAPRDSFYRVPHGLGWALVGDAGFYKDPLPGQGIHDAMRSAELVTQAFGEYCNNGATPRAWNEAFSRYRETRDRETRTMYELTDYLAHLDKPRSALELGIFRDIAAMPDWSDRYVSMFNGVIDPAVLVKFPAPLRIFVEARWRQFRGDLTGHGNLAGQG
jgi:flavin-dependent dehydrogenase